MATTSQLLTWIELECHGWNREGSRGSRSLLNEAHRMLLFREDDTNIVFDTSTGNLPYLSTSNGVYEYNLPTACYVLKHILVDNMISTNDYGSSVSSSTSWKFEDYSIAGRSYYRVMNIRSYPSTPSTRARVLFTENPGATDDVFRELYHKQPVQILSDTIQHEMPGATDVQYLMPATVALINSINDHDKYEKAKLMIEREYKPRVLSELNIGEQGQSDFCIKRAF
jgi:hypothetical protein